MEILIIAKKNKKGIEAAKKLSKELEKRNCKIKVDPITSEKMQKDSCELIDFNGDIVITLGGDGTFLWASHNTNKPILPVCIEGKGFLSTIELPDLIRNIGNLVNKKYEIITKQRLTCDSDKKYRPAMNEIVLARIFPSKILETEITIENEKFVFRGDGVLLSTSQGSTGYTASAGGFIVDPELETINIVPMNPLYSKIKSFIVPLKKEIKVKINHNSVLTIDGHQEDNIEKGKTLIIKKGRPIKIIKLLDNNFYRTSKNEHDFSHGSFYKKLKNKYIN